MTAWELLVILLLVNVELEETTGFLFVVFELIELGDELTWVGWVLAEAACWLKIVLHF